MPRRPRIVLSATDKQMRICAGSFELGDFFEAKEIVQLTALARQRIIGVFRHARMTVRKHVTDPYEREFDKYYGRQGTRTRVIDTDNYIVGVSERPGELATFVQKSIRNRFITLDTLRSYSKLSWVLNLADYHINQFIGHLTYQLLLLELNYMIDRSEVWYEKSHGGIWQLTQSVVDEHLQRREAARRAVKFDQRPEHGQVRAQRKRRERPSGTSTGEGKDSRAIGRRSWQ